MGWAASSAPTPQQLSVCGIFYAVNRGKLVEIKSSLIYKPDLFQSQACVI
jgi:hypothetical protein